MFKITNIKVSLDTTTKYSQVWINDQTDEGFSFCLNICLKVRGYICLKYQRGRCVLAESIKYLGLSKARKSTENISK